MALRFDNLEQLGQCSPEVRAQLERALGVPVVLNPALQEAELRMPSGTAKVKRARPEQDAGELLIQWVQLLPPVAGVKPWDLFYHVPNGGFRNPIEAKIFYGQGVRSGWPDYGLDLPLGIYHGMRMELKALNGDKPDAEQLEILARLERVGYYVRVAWGFEEAKHAIEQYLAFGS